MPGPYFEEQQPAVCGCFYPDVTRFSDDFSEKTRKLYCINHGWVDMSLAGLDMDTASGEVEPIPTDEWRKKERNRLQNGKHCREPGCNGFVVPNNFHSLQVGGCAISKLGFYCDVEACGALYRWYELEPIFGADGQRLYYRNGKVVAA